MHIHKLKCTKNQVIKHSSFLQGIQVISPLKIKDSCIRSIEGVYTRSCIAFSTFKTCLHTFKVPLLHLLHSSSQYLHSFIRWVSSTFIHEGFGVTLISLLVFFRLSQVYCIYILDYTPNQEHIHRFYIAFMLDL